MIKCTHITLISTSPVNSHILPSLYEGNIQLSKYPSSMIDRGSNIYLKIM